MSKSECETGSRRVLGRWAFGILMLCGGLAGCEGGDAPAPTPPKESSKATAEAAEAAPEQTASRDVSSVPEEDTSHHVRRMKRRD